MKKLACITKGCNNPGTVRRRMRVKGTKTVRTCWLCNSCLAKAKTGKVLKSNPAYKLKKRIKPFSPTFITARCPRCRRRVRASLGMGTAKAKAGVKAAAGWFCDKCGSLVRRANPDIDIRPKGKYVRYRQIPPEKLDPRSMRTVTAKGKSGTKIVVGCPKGYYDPRKKVCTVGMRAQS
ncbi:MAG: hypothetical protein ABID40_01265, partial [Candidatus Bipolaricaulota bacterium]